MTDTTLGECEEPTFDKESPHRLTAQDYICVYLFLPINNFQGLATAFVHDIDLIPSLLMYKTGTIQMSDCVVPSKSESKSGHASWLLATLTVQ